MDVMRDRCMYERGCVITGESFVNERESIVGRESVVVRAMRRNGETERQVSFGRRKQGADCLLVRGERPRVERDARR